MKRLLYVASGVLAIVAMAGRSGWAAEKPAAPKYEKMLYDLGAFPVAKLTQPYWTNGHPGEVYSKGTRVDVDGWLSPYWAPSYLTEAEKVQYGIPKKLPSYEQCVAMLDIDTYKRTHDPMLFLVMRFTLESMRQNDMRVRIADILRVYEAKVGLEPFAVPLLWGRWSNEDAMRLIGTYGDERLFDVLPKPQPTDKAYIAFLVEQAGAAKWPTHCRHDAFKLLFAVDEKTYRKPYREFLLSHVKTTENWWERADLYRGLTQLKDDESLRAVREGLVHDPVTECRESILYGLEERGEVASAIDAILVIANGQDDKHAAVTPSRGPEQWSHRLNEYLQWAKSQKGLDVGTLKKVDEAIEKLGDPKLRQWMP